MPIHLPPISRRRFLAGSLAAAAACALPRELLAAEKPIDPHSFALLSDSHINKDPAAVSNKANMADNFRQVTGEVLALPQRPATVLINGDLAHLRGEAKDYEVFVDLLKPLREGQVPITLTLGNHDQRPNFFAALPKGGGSGESPVDDRHASMIEAPRANWFLLDTLKETNKTPGIVGEAQLKWLAAALDEHKDKPAIVMAHHTPAPGDAKTAFGVIDTDALFAVLLPRRQVKAYIHGHSHDWKYSSIEDLHVVSLPPTAYLFNPRKPNGWVHMRLKENSATLEVRALDTGHREHGKVTELGWR